MIVAHPARPGIDASSSRGGRGDAHNELRRRPTGRSRGMRAERFVPKQARACSRAVRGFVPRLCKIIYAARCRVPARRACSASDL